MKQRYLHFFAIAVLLGCLLSCQNGNGNSTPDDAKSIEMQYASLLALHQCEGYVSAEIKNPWDSTKILHRYILVPKDQQLPASLPKGDVVRTPLSHAVFYTSVHTSLINQLGAYSSIAGVCDVEYMYLDKLQKDVKTGKISDCGKGVSPNIEKIIDISPDAILLSPFENSGSYGKLGTLGIPIIECADYMETSALGRAEWMRFYGLLTGREHEADSLFATIEKSYNDLKDLVKDVKVKPTVFTDMKFGASWYVAGVNSTVGHLLADAGAEYIFNDEPASGSVPYAPEVVFDRGQHADLWLIKYNQEAEMTYAQLANDWSSYTRLSAYQKHNVYACNLSKVPFYEETPFHPDLLLRDYITIFHPEVMKDKTLRYFSKMEK